jgi:hypothetical protein
MRAFLMGLSIASNSGAGLSPPLTRGLASGSLMTRGLSSCPPSRQRNASRHHPG